jgi:hypothetical protein
MQFASAVCPGWKLVMFHGKFWFPSLKFGDFQMTKNGLFQLGALEIFNFCMYDFP